MNPPDAPQPEPASPAGPPSKSLFWPLLLTATLAPPLLTALAASLDRRGAAAPALMFLAGGGGGILAGVMLGCRVGKSTPAKVLWSAVLAGLLAVACVTLCGLGCAIGGYKLDFR